MRTAMRRWLAAGTAALAVLGLAVPDLWAQDTEVAERGLQVTGSYRLGDIETVNTKNGNVMLRVPLASLPPGRGGDPGFQLTLNYNSKLWDIYVEHVEDPSDPTNPIPGNDPNPGNALSYRVKQTLKQAHGESGLELQLSVHDRSGQAIEAPLRPDHGLRPQQHQDRGPAALLRI